MLDALSSVQGSPIFRLLDFRSSCRTWLGKLEVTQRCRDLVDIRQYQYFFLSFCLWSGSHHFRRQHHRRWCFVGGCRGSIRIHWMPTCLTLICLWSGSRHFRRQHHRRKYSTASISCMKRQVVGPNRGY